MGIAHSMEISSILQRVSSQTLEELRTRRERPSNPAAVDAPVVLPEGPGHILRFRQNGWVQRVEPEAVERDPGRPGVRRAP